MAVIRSVFHWRLDCDLRAVSLSGHRPRPVDDANRRTVAESLRAPAGDALVIPDLLRNRPVRRISHLQGFVGTVERPVPFRFTSADFELISTTGDDTNKDAIRFRDGGRRPLPNTELTVNYYPVRSNPTPLNDLNVGSVVRTLVETIAFEMAVTYQHLDFIYKSAFVETAEGRSLDKVVALVGVARLASGHPVAKVRFSRRAGDTGRITVPTGTVITDDDGNRYLTQDELILEPGESTRDVIAAGDTPAQQSRSGQTRSTGSPGCRHRQSFKRTTEPQVESGRD